MVLATFRYGVTKGKQNHRFCELMGLNILLFLPPQVQKVEPYVVHTTFQYGGTKGKQNRLREAQMWVDPPAYYADGKFLSFDLRVRKLCRGVEHSSLIGARMCTCIAHAFMRTGDDRQSGNRTSGRVRKAQLRRPRRSSPGQRELCWTASLILFGDPDRLQVPDIPGDFDSWENEH